MDLRSVRQTLLTRPIRRLARPAFPRLSDTERQALEAGDVWWDAELFSGAPEWRTLVETPAPSLSRDERAFLDGPVEELCTRLDDWHINWERRDLPPAIWDFLKRERFFGLIIPTRYGGCGFSAFAHSEVIRKISSRSMTAAVTVMVPNSLGPAELLLKYGTEAQQAFWLPRLADGRELPCFGLTSPEAGSDAAAMIDRGVVCRERRNGREVLGIRLTWHKRYITLAPVATVLGLAFKLEDPDRLLDDRESQTGITVALVPTATRGVEIGRRHLPCLQAFQNGPTRGEDVFVSMDHVIGGGAQLGRGWRMLMSALADGRGISLPSLSASGTALAARTTGAYARVRRQFNRPIGEFEGVQHRLARLAAAAYLLDAGRRLTCAGLDQGRTLAVISAIMKVHATNRMRQAIDDAMDVHAGKTVIDGPLNYLGNLHRATPVGITVEGANILSRNLIIFGQGAIRCHPWLWAELRALSDDDEARSLRDFDRAFWAHVGHAGATVARAWLRSWSGGRIGPGVGTGAARAFSRQLSRYAAGFALTAEVALMTLGGAVKRREMLSARLGDILSELYLLSAALKRWLDDGEPEADLPLLRHCMEQGFATIETRLSCTFANLPRRPAAWALQALVLPRGRRRLGPTDATARACASILLDSSATRDRLTSGLFRGVGDDGLARLERAHRLAIVTEPIRDRLRRADIDEWHDRRATDLLSEDDRRLMQAADDATARVIEVDDFAPDEVSPPAAARAPHAEVPVGHARSEAS